MIRRLTMLGLSLTLVACTSGSVPTLPPMSFPASSPFVPPAASIDISAILDKVLAERKEMTETEVTEADPAVFVSDLKPGQPDGAVVKQYLEATIAHLDRVWTNWFLAQGLTEPWTSYTIIMPETTSTSLCSLGGKTTFGSDFANAFYCPTDPVAAKAGELGGIYLPLDTMGKMWTGEMFGRHVKDPSKVGDFAAAMLTAHEFGHHIQNELAIQTKSTDPIVPNKELIADCFAGVWTYAVFLDNYLEAGDVDEAIAAVGVIGDFNPTTGTHGSSEQRMTAYKIGYYGTVASPVQGAPGNCIAEYWK